MVSLEPTGTLGTKGRERMLRFIRSDSGKISLLLRPTILDVTVVFWLVASEPVCSILHFGSQ